MHTAKTTGKARMTWNRKPEALRPQIAAALLFFFIIEASSGRWKASGLQFAYLHLLLPAFCAAGLLRAGWGAAALAKLLAHHYRLYLLWLGRAALHAAHVRDDLDRLADEPRHRPRFVAFLELLGQARPDVATSGEALAQPAHRHYRFDRFEPPGSRLLQILQLRG